VDLPNGFTKQQIAGCITAKRLQLTIFPTEKCNFRCTYCYEDFLIGRMSEANQRGVKNLITNRASELKELSISWFGGEPLLALPVIRNICKHAKALSEEHGFAFDGGFTTNAYLLTREVMEELVSLHQTFYQITLDGWGSQHDKTRKRADGAGTFEKIWANLLDIKQSSARFEIVFRIHLTHENFDSLKELCTHLGQEFGRDNRFRLNFQDIRDLGGSGSENITPITADTYKSRSQQLARVFAIASGVPVEEFKEVEVEVQTGESASGRRAYEMGGNEPYICYASKPNHLMIRANGRIGKCTVALDDARNDLGKICEDGTISIDQEKARKWYGGFTSFDIDQMGCPILFIDQSKPTNDAAVIPIEVMFA